MGKKSTLKERFAARLRALMSDRTYTIDDMVRHGPTLKSGTVRRWVDASRMPSPQNIVNAARALDVDPHVLLEGVDAPKRTIRDVETIMRQNGAMPGAASAGM